jgi:hypothetical protein
MQNSNTWHPTLDKLAAFDQGRLPDFEWTVLERHVAECDLCLQRLEALPDDSLVLLLRNPLRVGELGDSGLRVGGSVGPSSEFSQ